MSINKHTGKQTVYMAVSNDKYELPIFITETQEELAKLTGRKRASIASYLSNKTRRHYGLYKLLKVEVDDIL